MKNFFKNRYYLHAIIGAILGYALSTTFDGIILPLRMLISALVVGGIAFFWEAYWNIKNETVPDFKDVLWSVIGGFCGVIFFFLQY